MNLEEIEMKTIFWDQLDRVIISPEKQTAFTQSHVTHACVFSVLNREKEQNTKYRINDDTHSY